MGMRIEPRAPGAYLIGEDSPTLSRAVVSIAQGVDPIHPGTVLGARTATGVYAPYREGATDGTQVASAIAYGRTPGGAGTVKAVVSIRDCQVASGALLGLTALAAEQLAARGIGVLRARSDEFSTGITHGDAALMLDSDNITLE